MPLRDDEIRKTVEQLFMSNPNMKFQIISITKNNDGSIQCHEIKVCIIELMPSSVTW